MRTTYPSLKIREMLPLETLVLGSTFSLYFVLRVPLLAVLHDTLALQFVQPRRAVC